MDKIKIGKTNYAINVIDAFWNKAVVARIDYENRTITLAKRNGVSNTPRSHANVEHSFWHETVHGILKDMGSPLESNERFVDGFAVRLTKLLRQVYPNENNLVTQRLKRIRKLRPQILRNDRIKETQVSRNRTDTIRKRTAQSGRTLRKGRPALRAV